MEGDVSKLTYWYKTKGEKKSSGSWELLNPFKQIHGRGAGLSVTGIASARAKPELGNHNQIQPQRAAPGRWTKLFKKGEFLPGRRQDTMGCSSLLFLPLLTCAPAPPLCSTCRDSQASLCTPLVCSRAWAGKESMLYWKELQLRLWDTQRHNYLVLLTGFPASPPALRGLIPSSWAGFQRYCSLWLQLALRNLQNFAALIRDRWGSYSLKCSVPKVKNYEIPRTWGSTLSCASSADHREHVLRECWTQGFITKNITFLVPLHFLTDFQGSFPWELPAWLLLLPQSPQHGALLC